MKPPVHASKDVKSKFDAELLEMFKQLMSHFKTEEESEGLRVIVAELWRRIYKREDELDVLKELMENGFRERDDKIRHLANEIKRMAAALQPR